MLLVDTQSKLPDDSSDAHVNVMQVLENTAAVPLMCRGMLVRIDGVIVAALA